MSPEFRAGERSDERPVKCCVCGKRGGCTGVVCEGENVCDACDAEMMMDDASESAEQAREAQDEYERAHSAARLG